MLSQILSIPENQILPFLNSKTETVLGRIIIDSPVHLVWGVPSDDHFGKWRKLKFLRILANWPPP
jgi:hypothetical protein